MSPLDHVSDQYNAHDGGESSQRFRRVDEQNLGSGQMKRRGTPLELGDSSSTLFSPILSALPVLNSLKSYLPTSPPRQDQTGIPSKRRREAVWQEVDLQDGKGKRSLLVISSDAVALQIWTVKPSRIPDDPHIQEDFPPPEQIFSLRKVTVDEKGWEGTVVTARTTDPASWQGNGPLIAAVCTLSAGTSKRKEHSIWLILISLRTGKTIQSVQLGQGSDASLSTSARTIAVAISKPSPTVHLRDPITLKPLHNPITDLPASSHSSLPVFSLSGRLLAFATSESSQKPGPRGLGSLITAQSAVPHTTSSTASNIPLPAPSTDPGAALLQTAVEVGGAVGRGVWAGLKMGAQAAGKARANRLARSAPSGSMEDKDDEDAGLISAPRSLEDSNLLDSLSLESGQAIESPKGEWVKVIDVSPPGDSDPKTVAHFKLPPSRQILPNLNTSNSKTPFHPTSQNISNLYFSPDGTQLLVVPSAARALHVIELHPFGSARQSRDVCQGEAWHLYELRRGNTSAILSGVSWDPTGRWLSACTTKRTAHIFPIHPSGSPPSSSIHASLKNYNPSSLHPLSIVIYPSTRIRAPLSTHDPANPQAGTESDWIASTFGPFREVSLSKGTIAQDVYIARFGGELLELARMLSSPASTVIDSTRPKGSGITEMMRLRSAASDFHVESTVKARWRCPVEDDLGDCVLSGDENRREPTSRSPLSQIEIQTHSVNSRILPPTIYLSRQVDFFSSVNESTPFTNETKRNLQLHYRDEVEAKASLESSSFDQPLLSALHSIDDTPPESQIPGLPNGRPGKWRSPIPMRQVASGLHEGVEMIQREYIKKQKKRSSIAAVNGLSFEDDTVFPSSGEGSGGDHSSGSPPSSDNLPSSVVGDDEEWSDKWEEEYRRAVEDDGGPDDLVLGLMDEEQEEKRKWEVRQKNLAKQYKQ